MPTFARKSPESDKKRKSPQSTNPRKLQRQTRPKSIKQTTAKYPSPPGVEGAPARPARLTARGTPPPEGGCKKERKRHLSPSPLKPDISKIPTRACLPKDEAGNFVAEQEKSDVVHDLLAFLAERMLEMNKQKQQEIKGFLGWLESYLGAKVEDLTPKTKLQSYYEHDYRSFLEVLKKNWKKLSVDPARREPGEVLRAEFEGSVGKL